MQDFLFLFLFFIFFGLLFLGGGGLALMLLLTHERKWVRKKVSRVEKNFFFLRYETKQILLKEMFWLCFHFLSKHVYTDGKERTKSKNRGEKITLWDFEKSFSPSFLDIQWTGPKKTSNDPSKLEQNRQKIEHATVCRHADHLLESFSAPQTLEGGER